MVKVKAGNRNLFTALFLMNFQPTMIFQMRAVNSEMEM